MSTLKVTNIQHPDAASPSIIMGSGGGLSLDGSLVLSTSGAGIDFSATSDGSGTTTTEVLDDYEEGTFTPVPYLGATEQTVNGQQLGSYIKIGGLVWFNMTCNDIVESGSGQLTVQGLPFAIRTSQGAHACLIRWDRINTSGLMFGYLWPDITGVLVQNYSSSGYVSNVNQTSMSTNYDFLTITGLYATDS